MVKDKRGNPLAFANVQLVYTSSQRMASYAISDKTGAFSLWAKPGTYLLKVSFVGFETGEKNLEVKVGQHTLHTQITLLKSRTLLDEVNATVNLQAVQVLGDTIRYRPSMFSDSTERNLKEALEKLPGFTISEQGKVSVNGKAVDKVLIDGDDFMNDQSEIALETLPADAAKDVDYIKHYNDSKVARGMASDKTALDIKLQEKYRHRWKGDLKAGAGYKDRGLAALNGYNLNKAFKVYYAGALNNTGSSALGFQDYAQIVGGFEGFGQLSTTTIRPSKLSSSLKQLATLNRDDAQHIRAQSQSISLSIKPDKTLKVTSYGIFGQTISDKFTRQRRTYFSRDSADDQDFRRDIDAQQNFVNTSVTARYTPSDRFELHYDFRFNTLYSLQNQVQTQQDTTSKQHSKLRNYIHNSNLTLRDRLGKNSLGTLSCYAQNLDENARYRLEARDNPSAIQEERGATLNQYRHVQHSEYGFIPSYTYKAGKTSLSLRSGLRYADEAFKIQDLLGDSQFQRPELRTQTVALEGTIEKNEGTIQYQLLPKLTYRNWNYHLNDTQRRAGYFFEPLLQVSYHWRDAHSISLSYQRQNQAYTLQQLYDGYTSDEASVYRKGGLSLGYSTSDAYSVYYTLIDQISQLNLFASARYTIARNTVTSRAALRGGERFVSAAINPKSEAFNGHINVSKRLGILPLRIYTALGYGLQHSNSYVGDTALEIKNTDYNAELGFWTTFKKGLNFHPRFSYTHNENQGLGSDHNNAAFDQYDIGGTLRGHPIKNLGLRISYGYNYYDAGDLKQTLNQLGGDIWYARPKGKFEYRLRMVDLLNLDNRLRVSYQNTDFYQQQISSSTVPGYLLLELKYRF